MGKKPAEMSVLEDESRRITKKKKNILLMRRRQRRMMPTPVMRNDGVKPALTFLKVWRELQLNLVSKKAERRRWLFRDGTKRRRADDGLNASHCSFRGSTLSLPAPTLQVTPTIKTWPTRLSLPAPLTFDFLHLLLLFGSPKASTSTLKRTVSEPTLAASTLGEHLLPRQHVI